MADQDQDGKAPGGLVFSVATGALVLLVALGLTCAELDRRFAPSKLGPLPFVPVWALAINLLVSPWPHRAARRLASAAGTLVLVVLAPLVLAAAAGLDSLSSSQRPAPFGIHSAGLLLLAAAFGGLWLMATALLQHHRALRDAKPPPPLAAGALLFWPLLAFAKAPLPAGVAAALASATTLLGEWLGEQAGHPLAGGTIGLLAPLAVGGALAGREVARQVRGGR